MRLLDLYTLHCPFCGSDIELASQSGCEADRSKDDTVRYGVLRCACSRFPVVEGIPILQQTEGLGSVVDLIEKKEFQRALLHTMNVFRIKWAHRTRWHQLRYYLNCRQLITSQGLYFEDALNLVRKPKVFSDYLFHRYANPSFLACAGALQLLGSLTEYAEGGSGKSPILQDTSKGSCEPNHRNEASSNSTLRVMDLACGAGHSSFLMRHLYPELSVVSADSDFISLYLTKRFLSPGAPHVCFDAEFPVPFPDDHFNAVCCLDAFHYFHSKKAILTELNRVLTSEALWLFPHLHNALEHNIVAGVPLSPEKYLECFSFLDGRLFDEAEMLRGLSERHVLDLGTQMTLSQLNKSRTLTFIGGPRQLWRLHHEFPCSFYRDRSSLVINPIYRIRETQGDFELTLNWPNPVMREECSSAEAILPVKYRLSKSELRALFVDHEGSIDERLSELVGRFVLVLLPNNYARNGRQPITAANLSRHSRRCYAD